MSDISGTTISISGDSNDTNLVIHSVSGTISDGAGEQGAPGPAGATGATGAAGAAGLNGLDTERYVQANNYKFLVPNNVLTAPVDVSVTGLKFAHTPVLTLTIPELVGPIGGESNKFYRGMNLPEYSYNCGGTYVISLAMYNLINVAGASVFDSNGVSLLNNIDVQKIFGLHLKTLADEVAMGWDYASTPVMPANHRDAGFMPTPEAATAAALLDPSGLHSWDQSSVDLRYAALQDLSGITDLVSTPWDAKYGTLFGYFEGLELIHINRCLLLSGVNPADISWGTTNFAVKVAEILDPTSIIRTVFTSFVGAAAAGAPFVPLDIARVNLAEFYKKIVPDNVLIGPVNPDSGLVFEPLTRVTYSGAGDIYTRNSLYRGMSMPVGSYMCIGTYVIMTALYGLLDVPQCPCPPALINNIDVQKILALHSNTLKAEIDLGFDFATMPDNYASLATNAPTQLAIDNAIANKSAFAWTADDVSARYTALHALKTNIDALTDLTPWDASYGSFFDWVETLEMFHIPRVMALSGVSMEDCSWGTLNLTNAVNEILSSPIYNNGSSPSAVSLFVAAQTASGPYVPTNALDASGNVLPL